MFAYCENNPINRIDCDGDFWGDLKDWIQEKYNAVKEWAVNTFNGQESHTNVSTYKEHQKKGTTNPANKNKHEKGTTRKKRDQRGEKGDARRSPNPNKRRTSMSEVEISEKVVAGIVVAIATVSIAYIVVNDITGVGVADDPAVTVLAPIAWEGLKIIVT